MCGGVTEAFLSVHHDRLAPDYSKRLAPPASDSIQGISVSQDQQSVQVDSTAEAGTAFFVRITVRWQIGYTLDPFYVTKDVELLVESFFHGDEYLNFEMLPLLEG